MVKIYTTGCPRCQVLEDKLEDAGIKFEKEEDVGIMLNKGFVSVPILEVDGKVMNYKEAFNWITDRKDKND